MAVNSGHSEYGNHLKYMVFTFIDVLKKQILEVEDIALGVVITGFKQNIAFQTIPIRN